MSDFKLFEMAARGHCRAKGESINIKPKVMDKYIEDNWNSHLVDLALGVENFEKFQTSETMKLVSNNVRKAFRNVQEKTG